MKSSFLILILFLTLAGNIPLAAASGPVLVIGIAGASGAGKTELAKAILKNIDSSEVAILPQDSYFQDWDQLPKEHYINGQPNGDHPSAIDFNLMIEHIEAIKEGKTVQIPRYDYIEDKKFPDGPKLESIKVLIVEGLFTLWNPKLRKLLDYSIFVNADSDLRLGRRIKRDFAERGKDTSQIIDYYLQVVRPMQKQFIDPTVRFADKKVDGENIKGSALEISAEVVHYLNRIQKKEAAFFYDREIVPYTTLNRDYRGESIEQLVLQQGPESVVLVEGGSLRPPTHDHMGLLIQTMTRFGLANGKFLPANKYKAGAISNAAALLLSQVAVQNFNEALDANSISYLNFNYNPQSGARWQGKEGKQFRLQVDSSEIDIKDPIVDGEDRRTLLAFEALKNKAGGNPKSVFWLAGGDSFASLPQWNSHWQEHLNLANWIIVSRPEFDGKDNNISFESHDPIRFLMPQEVMDRYTYYFDHTSQTHIYENKDPKKPNIYVIRLAKNGVISASSVRTSLSQNMDHRLIARAGTTKSVFEASLSHGFFEAASLEMKPCQNTLLKKTNRKKGKAK